MFHRNDYAPVEIYINDKLVIKWEGPRREMDDVTNHFFNYNSWHVDTISERELEVVFTISDLDTE